MDGFVVIPYTSEYEEAWDHFVNIDSINGTFLQTRRFLNYHPRGRFDDCSIMVFDNKNHMVAVVPACVFVEGKKRTFYSHKGSTYGGVIIKKEFYLTERVMGIIQCIDHYLREKYDEVVLKITADIHSVESSDLLQYVLGHQGYDQYTELNSYVNLMLLQEDIVSSFDRNKVRNIKKCEAHNLTFRELESDEEIELFHRLLTINLTKYDLRPIHTVNEVIRFKHDIIPENVKFYGVFQEQEMMAGGMMFIFDRANVIHAQNLSADFRFDDYSPITYMYYRVIKKAKEKGYKALSWGISTEDRGEIINYGLIRNKESYGSKIQLNRTFYKSF